MSIVISAERPDTADAIRLITELEDHLAPQYPAASRHGFSVEKLIAQAVAFFVVRYNGVPACTGGIKLFGSSYDPAYGELKRMYVRPQFRGLGLAKQMVSHLEAYAQAHNVYLTRLETGVYQTEAIGLYERMGYYPVPPFGDYKVDPLSLFYEKKLAKEQP
jgi:ribosomal protein S18 acetylase RimI-like enzyme